MDVSDDSSVPISLACGEFSPVLILLYPSLRGSLTSLRVSARFESNWNGQLSAATKMFHHRQQMSRSPPRPQLGRDTRAWLGGGQPHKASLCTFDGRALDRAETGMFFIRRQIGAHRISLPVEEERLSPDRNSPCLGRLVRENWNRRFGLATEVLRSCRYSTVPIHTYPKLRPADLEHALSLPALPAVVSLEPPTRPRNE